MFQSFRHSLQLHLQFRSHVAGLIIHIKRTAFHVQTHTGWHIREIHGLTPGRTWLYRSTFIIFNTLFLVHVSLTIEMVQTTHSNFFHNQTLDSPLVEQNPRSQDSVRDRLDVLLKVGSHRRASHRTICLFPRAGSHGWHPFSGRAPLLDVNIVARVQLKGGKWFNELHNVLTTVLVFNTTS